MTAVEAKIAYNLNNDVAFQFEGITVRAVHFDHDALKVVAIFNTPFENDRVAVVDLPGEVFLRQTVENLLFARIYSKVGHN